MNPILHTRSGNDAPAASPWLSRAIAVLLAFLPAIVDAAAEGGLCAADQAVAEATHAFEAAIDVAEASYRHQRGAEAQRARAHIAAYREMRRLEDVHAAAAARAEAAWDAYHAALSMTMGTRHVLERAIDKVYRDAREAALEDAWAAVDAADAAWHDAQLAAEAAEPALAALEDASVALLAAWAADDAARDAYQEAYNAAATAGLACDEDAACREARDAFDAARAAQVAAGNAWAAAVAAVDPYPPDPATICERDTACREARDAYHAAEEAANETETTAYDDGTALLVARDSAREAVDAPAKPPAKPPASPTTKPATLPLRQASLATRTRSAAKPAALLRLPPPPKPPTTTRLR